MTTNTASRQGARCSSNVHAKKKSVVPSLFTSAGAKRSARLEKGVKVLLTRETAEVVEHAFAGREAEEKQGAIR